MLALAGLFLTASTSAGADCVNLSGEFELQSATERSSTDEEIGGDREEFTYGSRHFLIRQADCGSLVLTPFWSVFGGRKYGESRTLEIDGDGAYFVEWRFLHFKLALKITSTANANVVALRYTRQRWVFDGAFAPLAWYEASFISF